MDSSRPLSPAARLKLRTGVLIWGILLVGLWLAASIGVALHYSAQVGVDAQASLWLLLLPGLLLLVFGVRGARAARRFNVIDSAFADALDKSLDELWHTSRFEAYRTDREMAEVGDARLVEIKRHFDQQTVGNVAGRMSHQLSFFGGALSRTYGRWGVGGLSGAVNGLSAVDLTVHETTRDNLMGDSLFAVFEASGPAGERDVYRVVSVSGPAATEWVGSLLLATANQLEGPRTHSGATLLDWTGNLVAQFAPEDISYATRPTPGSSCPCPRAAGRADQ